MKVPKQKVRVKIKTESAVIIGHVHIMVDGRMSDYLSSQKDKFIPVTEAVIYLPGDKVDDNVDTSKSSKIVFINLGIIEMLEYL